MKQNLIKFMSIPLLLFMYSELRADYNITVTNNLLGNVSDVRVYDANNNLLTFSGTIIAGANWIAICDIGVPSYIHVIDAGGCLYSITNLNSVVNCSTCTSCTVFTTATTFTCSDALTSSCTPVTHDITLSIDP